MSLCRQTQFAPVSYQLMLAQFHTMILSGMSVIHPADGDLRLVSVLADALAHCCPAQLLLIKIRSLAGIQKTNNSLNSSLNEKKTSQRIHPYRVVHSAHVTPQVQLTSHLTLEQFDL